MTARSIADVRRDARKVSERVKLDQIHLVGLEFETHLDLEVNKYHVETRLQVLSAKRGKGALVVETRHESIAWPENASNIAEPSWRTTVEHEAVFVLENNQESDFSDDEYTAFGIEVATDIIHPYAREVTQSLTARSPFPSFTIARSQSIWERDPDEMIEIDSAVQEESFDDDQRD